MAHLHRAATAATLVVLAGCAAAPVPPSGGPSAQEPTKTTTTEPPPAPAVSPVTAAELGATWGAGCPVAPSDLRKVEIDFLGFDGRDQRGVLVVHRDIVDDVLAVFAELRAMNYPIQRMRTPDHYPEAADELSMRDNNTSAFNCRPLPGSDSWSQHAYGRAVDVNPLLNPSLGGRGGLEPATAEIYLDRTRDDPGMLRPGSPAVQAFTKRGWTWGGAWRDPIDYQHFEIG